MFLLYTEEPAPSDIQTFTAEQLLEVAKAATEYNDRHRTFASIVFDLVQYGQIEKAKALIELGRPDVDIGWWLFIDANDLVSYVLQVKQWPEESVAKFVALLSSYDVPVFVG